MEIRPPFLLLLASLALLAASISTYNILSSSIVEMSNATTENQNSSDMVGLDSSTSVTSSNSTSYNNAASNDASFDKSTFSETSLGKTTNTTTNTTGFNGTTFMLNGSKAHVVIDLNAGRYEFEASYAIKNLSVSDTSGKTVPFNLSETFWGGVHFYNVTLQGMTRGQLAFELPSQNQHFLLPMEIKGPLRVILPEGYSTGERVLGIPYPEPDQITVEDNKTSLVWNDASDKLVEIGYYKDNAPRDMAMAFFFLGVLAVCVLAYQYISLRRLRAVGEDDANN